MGEGSQFVWPECPGKAVAFVLSLSHAACLPGAVSGGLIRPSKGAYSSQNGIEFFSGSTRRFTTCLAHLSVLCSDCHVGRAPLAVVGCCRAFLWYSRSIQENRV